MNRIEQAKAAIVTAEITQDPVPPPYTAALLNALLTLAVPVIEAALELEQVSGPSMADIPEADIKDLSTVGLASRKLSQSLAPWKETP